jgi:hypothetical protein
MQSAPQLHESLSQIGRNAHATQVTVAAIAAARTFTLLQGAHRQPRSQQELQASARVKRTHRSCRGNHQRGKLAHSSDETLPIFKRLRYAQHALRVATPRAARLRCVRRRPCESVRRRRGVLDRDLPPIRACGGAENSARAPKVAHLQGGVGLPTAPCPSTLVMP